MTNTIVAHVDVMFETLAPWVVNNSVANLGPDAGRMTWRNAMTIAENRDAWLVTNAHDACEAMRSWARNAGAWELSEILGWSNQECLALFVQNVASEVSELTDPEFPVWGEAVTMSRDGSYGGVGYYTQTEDREHYDVDWYAGI